MSKGSCPEGRGRRRPGEPRPALARAPALPRARPPAPACSACGCPCRAAPGPGSRRCPCRARTRSRSRPSPRCTGQRGGCVSAVWADSPVLAPPRSGSRFANHLPGPGLPSSPLRPQPAPPLPQTPPLPPEPQAPLTKQDTAPLRSKRQCAWTWQGLWAGLWQVRAGTQPWLWLPRKPRRQGPHLKEP